MISYAFKLSSQFDPFLVTSLLPAWSKPPPFLVQTILSPSLPLLLPFCRAARGILSKWKLVVLLVCLTRSGNVHAHCSVCITAAVPGLCQVPRNNYWVREGSRWTLFSLQFTSSDLIHTLSLRTLILIPQFVIPAETLLRATSISTHSVLTFLLPPDLISFIWENLFFVYEGVLPLNLETLFLFQPLNPIRCHSWFYLINKYCLCSHLPILIVTAWFSPVPVFTWTAGINF